MDVFNVFTDLYDEINNFSATRTKAATKEPKQLKVYGMPLAYSNLVDPRGRIFRKTILANMPYVSMQPGIAATSFRGMTPENTAALKGRLTSINNLFAAGGTPADELVRKQLSETYTLMQEGKEQLPYLIFDPAYKEFQKVYNTLAQRVFSRMAVEKGRDLKADAGWLKKMTAGISASIAEDITAESVSSGWLNFYLDRSTSITESGSNTYGESMFSDIQKKISGASREVQNLLGVQQGKEVNAADNQHSGFLGKVMSAAEGNSVVFPTVWQDSTFARSYSLAFRFESPYGDSLSIWRHVYVPFLILLSLALPRQTGLTAYTGPFMVRVDAPGWFTIDCGIIKSISVKKGDLGWTAEGLPIGIDVNIEVDDMYPQLILANNPTILNLNFSLAAYLDSMTGVSYVESLTGGTVMHNLRALITRIVSRPRTYINDVEANMYQAAQNIGTKLFNW